MGGWLGKKGLYMVEENLEDQTTEGSGTEMEEPSGGKDLSKLEAQNALQEEGDACISQVPLEGNQPEQGDVASTMQKCKSADSPVGMGSKRVQPGERAVAGSELEPPSAPYLCMNPGTVASAPEEDPMLTPPPSPPSER